MPAITESTRQIFSALGTPSGVKEKPVCLRVWTRLAAKDAIATLGFVLRIYLYSGCDTCRRARKYLNDNGVAHVEVAIREQPPSEGELRRMLAAQGGDLRKLFNTSGQDYRKLGLSVKLPTLSVEAALDLLSKNGNLVKRPFVLTPNDGWLGFHEAEWRARLSLG